MRKLLLATMVLGLGACVAEPSELAGDEVPPVVSFPVPDDGAPAQELSVDDMQMAKESSSEDLQRQCSSLCAGEWGPSGWSDQETCRCRAADRGQQCLDSSDCSGLCLFDRFDHASMDDKTAYALGLCSEFVSPRGCIAILPDGLEQPVSLPFEPSIFCLD